MRLHQKADWVGHEELGSGGFDSSTALAHLRNSCFPSSLLRQGPTSQHGSDRSPEREAMLGADRHSFPGGLLNAFSTQLAQPGYTQPRVGFAERVIQLLGQEQGGVHTPPRLGWIAKQPLSQCQVGLHGHTGVDSTMAKD